RIQNEVALHYPRMWECQLDLIAPLAAVGDEIEVDDPRAPALVRLGTTHGRFNRFQLLQQRRRLELSEDAGDRVDEVRLRHGPERARAVEPRSQHETGVPQLPEPRDGREHLRTRILEIAADANVGGLPEIHGRGSGLSRWSCAAAPWAPTAARPRRSPPATL